MKTIGGSFLSLAGAGALVLGILFLAASGESSSRLTTGLVLAAAGCILLFAGIMLFRKGRSQSPESIRREILSLAKKNHGEVSAEALTGSLGKSDALEYELARFVRMGIATQSSDDGRSFYLFPDFQAEMMVKQCPYCGSDYPLRDGIEQCPACGGDLKTEIRRFLGAHDRFSMDE